MTPYNRVILTGRVANSPQRYYRPDGSPVVQFPLELNDSKDVAGQPSHSLINIVACGDLAEFRFDLLQNGQHLLVVGRLNQRHWQTPEGKHRTLTEVIATDLRKMGETSRTGE